MALRSVSYFRERDQGHDHVHHGGRDHGRGEGGQGHVGVNGIVEDDGRGENPLFLMINSKKRKICCMVKCTLVFYCTTVHLYCYSQLQPHMISNDFHLLR